MKKVQMYKGWVIAEDKLTDTYYVFTKDEYSYGEGYRTPEFECCSIQECKDNIDSY